MISFPYMQFSQVAKANSVLTHFDRLKCALREIQTFPLKKERVFHEVGGKRKKEKIFLESLIII